MKTSKCLISIILTALSACWLSGCAKPEAASDSSEVETMRARIAEVAKMDEAGKSNLANFDDLDFNVFSGQKWDELSKSHAKDIKVHWPDGHTTEGIDVHIADLKAMFVYAPDTRIKEHPIKIASGNYTAVTGIMEGTFTKPMPIGGGKTIPPTGKSFKLTMCTVGVWKDGLMSEEYLFWDNQTYMKQLGLAK